MGLGYALATATLFQSFIKIFVGGLRPHFLTVCVPILKPSISALPTLPTSDMAYYTAKQLCTGNKSRIKEAQMSFPSGHACAAFAGFGFLALWLNAKFKVLSRGSHFRDHYGREQYRERAPLQQGLGRRVHHWKLVLFVAPWCIAALFALSKVSDKWHHPIDVVFGSAVGIFFAHMAYKMVYWSVYDWRTNHIPLGDSQDQMVTVGDEKKERD
jgi:diacylglycerol diphosphate phosphatase/phosphatidate phosphatase